mmetsp:Transcript_38670/g.121836  ORF Transcript_38670/g.121836 Transcript_38670/m.121836 type:complete len:294 (-) Transcript_38670:158-1039(-)
MGRHKKRDPSPLQQLEQLQPFKAAEKRFKRYQGLRTDFSDVLRFRRELTQGPQDVEAHAVPGREGLFVFPGLLSASEQISLLERCLKVYPRPPHKSNLLPLHGRIDDPWAQEQLVAQLSWVTLGYQYDWTARRYPEEEKFPVPQEICALVDEVSSRMKRKQIVPEAVIVNYYSHSRTLGGHLDDVEPDQESPIISISLGCSAVFLAGGRTKDEEPIPLLLRSGDVMVMSGESRRCYHGVPRILSWEEEKAYFPEAQQLVSPADLKDRGEDGERMMEYFKSHRINLNVRQVHSN